MRILTLVMLLLMAGTALAGAHEQKIPDAAAFAAAASPEQRQLIADITAFLDAYAEHYNRQDYEALLAMWDGNDNFPMYMAEEINQPMYGWATINKYFNPIPGKQVLDGIRNAYSEVRAHYLAEDLALATYRLDFDIKVKRQKAMTSWDRVMAVFRRVDGEWKLTAYAEAPMAPLTMVRKMLENAVPEDFEEFLEEE